MHTVYTAKDLQEVPPSPQAVPKCSFVPYTCSIPVSTCSIYLQYPLVVLTCIIHPQHPLVLSTCSIHLQYPPAVITRIHLQYPPAVSTCSIHQTRAWKSMPVDREHLGNSSGDQFIARDETSRLLWQDQLTSGEESWHLRCDKLTSVAGQVDLCVETRRPLRRDKKTSVARQVDFWSEISCFPGKTSWLSWEDELTFLGRRVDFPGETSCQQCYDRVAGDGCWLGAASPPTAGSAFLVF